MWLIWKIYENHKFVNIIDTELMTSWLMGEWGGGGYQQTLQVQQPMPSCTISIADLNTDTAY